MDGLGGGAADAWGGSQTRASAAPASGAPATTPAASDPQHHHAGEAGAGADAGAGATAAAAAPPAAARATTSAGTALAEQAAAAEALASLFAAGGDSLSSSTSSAPAPARAPTLKLRLGLDRPLFEQYTPAQQADTMRELQQETPSFTLSLPPQQQHRGQAPLSTTTTTTAAATATTTTTAAAAAAMPAYTSTSAAQPPAELPTIRIKPLHDPLPQLRLRVPGLPEISPLARPAPAAAADGAHAAAVDDEDDGQLYCICRQPYSSAPGNTMVECDHCNDWFHLRCVNLTEQDVDAIDVYSCSRCEPKHGPTKWKRLRPRRIKHLQDLITTDVHHDEDIDFVSRMQSRQFLGDSCVKFLEGSELTAENAYQNGFDRPLFFKDSRELGIELPTQDYLSIDAIADVLGPDTPVNVIDVSTQSTLPTWTLSDWRDYVNMAPADRPRVLNVISLEVSRTILGDMIKAPTFVRKMDWMEFAWPLDAASQERKPRVQKYCLMGVEGAYTDFHIDFGGTSVWYHVVRGHKVFFFIEPTKANLEIYERWSSSSKQHKTCLSDLVDRCFRVEITTGQTLMIPSGWIHAVLTPKDSLVFGGNFLHNLALGMQLEVYGIEERVKISNKFRFPLFETAYWYALLNLVNQYPPPHVLPPSMVHGAQQVGKVLQRWLTTAQRQKGGVHLRMLPEGVNAERLLADFTALVDRSPDPMPKVTISINKPPVEPLRLRMDASSDGGSALIRPEPAEIAPVQLTIAARGGAAAAAEAAPVSPAKQPEPTKLPPLKQPPVFLEDKEFDNIDAEAMDGEWYVPTMEEDDDDFSISSSRSSSKAKRKAADTSSPRKKAAASAARPNTNKSKSRPKPKTAKMRILHKLGKSRR